ARPDEGPWGGADVEGKARRRPDTAIAVRYIGPIYRGDRSVLEMAVLGLLKERTMHGYELKKELTATLGQFWQVSYGSLYPTIRRLEVEGAVERIFPRGDVKRRKNIYRITAKGEAMFTDALGEPLCTPDDA